MDVEALQRTMTWNAQSLRIDSLDIYEYVLDHVQLHFPGLLTEYADISILTGANFGSGFVRRDLSHGELELYSQFRIRNVILPTVALEHYCKNCDACASAVEPATCMQRQGDTDAC